MAELWKFVGFGILVSIGIIFVLWVVFIIVDFIIAHKTMLQNANTEGEKKTYDLVREIKAETVSGTYADKKDTYADDSIKLPVPIVKPSEVLTALLCGPVGNVVVGSIEEKRMLKEAIQKIKEAGL